MPFVITLDEDHLVTTAVVAFDNPASHQNRVAVGVTNHLGTAPNGLGEQSARTPVTVISMFVLRHL